MTPSNEQHVAHALEMVRDSLLNNNPAISAYPHLQGPFFSLADTLGRLVKTLLNSQRDELLYGKTPAAKLFQMQYGKAHAIPEGVLKDTVRTVWDVAPSMPLVRILEYAQQHRAFDAPEMKLVNLADGHDFTFDTNTKEAVLTWPNCAVQLRLPHVGSNRAVVEGPLFHEPIDVMVDDTYLSKYLWDPLYAQLIGDKYLVVSDPDYMLMDHYFTTGIVGEDDFDHPVQQLRSLLSDRLYGPYNESITWIDWKDYCVSFSTTRKWEKEESLVLMVDVCRCSESSDPRPTRTPVNDWWKNPLLVYDLLTDMNSLIVQVLTRHEAQTQSQ